MFSECKQPVWCKFDTVKMMGLKLGNIWDSFTSCTIQGLADGHILKENSIVSVLDHFISISRSRTHSTLKFYYSVSVTLLGLFRRKYHHFAWKRQNHFKTCWAALCLALIIPLCPWFHTSHIKMCVQFSIIDLQCKAILNMMFCF